MNAEIKHGFDGNPPDMRPSSDLVGAKEARKLPDLWNIGNDRLNWYRAHNQLTERQWLAGTRIQRDARLAGLEGYAAPGIVSGGSGTNRLSDAKCDAIARMNDARECVGGTGWRFIELVAFENMKLPEAERKMRKRRGSGIGALTGALDSLAGFYARLDKA